MRAVMFPGQGSQYKGMGKDLFPKFREETRLASTILGYDIEDLCVNDPNKELGKTQFTQPALFVVNALSFMDQQKLTRPDFFLGHSLGEYNALFAAGAFSFETGVQLVKKRGELMAAANGGGMAAVLGLPEKELAKLLMELHYDAIDIANYNTPNQTVVAGPLQKINDLVKDFDARKIRAIPLFVSAAFHSRYMEQASEKFATFLSGFRFNHPQVSVISNVTSLPYESNRIPALLSAQICSSVQWNKSIKYLLSIGCNHFEQVNGNILTKMVEEVKSDFSPVPLNPSDSVSQPFEIAKKQSLQKVTEIDSNDKACRMGSADFRKEYHLKYSYITGGMHNGISSKEMVVRLARNGMLGSFGAYGLKISEAEREIILIREQVADKPFAVNIQYSINEAQDDFSWIDLLLKHQIKIVEAAGYIQITPQLAYYLLKGLRKEGGSVISQNRIIAKVSRPEVAEAFMKPAPEKMVAYLLEKKMIDHETAELSSKIPMSFDICVAADSGGTTDRGVALVLLPAIQQLRNRLQAEQKFQKSIRVGLAGGIGTPQSIACAFAMGADFIMTGSINQCTVEAAISPEVKEMLQTINVQDTDYAPWSDLFEIGAKAQVMKRGVLFPARANKLYNLYSQFNSLEEIPRSTLEQLEKNYFRKTIDEVWEEIVTSLELSRNYSSIERATTDPKYKMSLVFKSYLNQAMKSALEGDLSNKMNFQIQTGPSLGAFNQWVRGSPLEAWQNRHVEQIGIKLMEEAAEILNGLVLQFNDFSHDKKQPY